MTTERRHNAAQIGKPKRSRLHQHTCGRRLAERDGGKEKSLPDELEWKLESVTLARMRALGI